MDACIQCEAPNQCLTRGMYTCLTFHMSQFDWLLTIGCMHPCLYWMPPSCSHPCDTEMRINRLCMQMGAKEDPQVKCILYWTYYHYITHYILIKSITYILYTYTSRGPWQVELKQSRAAPGLARASQGWAKNRQLVGWTWGLYHIIACF